MRHVPLLTSLGCVLLFGAGCFAPIASPQIAQPLGQTLPDRPIAQDRGFGVIPPSPTPLLHPGRSGSVRVLTQLPEIPSNVTVLRLQSGQPNANELRNIAGALGIPGGVLGTTPRSHTLLLDWIDPDGFRWTYTAGERRLDFVDTLGSLTNLTSSIPPDNVVSIRTALGFLADHGINRRNSGTPYVDPDWNTWWQSAAPQDACMSAQSVATIRAQSASTLTTLQPPVLPQRKNTSCVTPEFPSGSTVYLNATQDNQSIFLPNGSPVRSVILSVKPNSGRTVAGSIYLRSDPDRSDYPAITLDEMRAALGQGGEGGTPDGDVTITDATFEWMRISDSLAIPTTYLYPALVGHGTIRFSNGTTGPYTVVVPLVKG